MIAKIFPTRKTEENEIDEQAKIRYRQIKDIGRDKPLGFFASFLIIAVFYTMIIGAQKMGQTYSFLYAVPMIACVFGLVCLFNKRSVYLSVVCLEILNFTLVEIGFFLFKYGAEKGNPASLLVFYGMLCINGAAVLVFYRLNYKKFSFVRQNVKSKKTALPTLMLYAIGAFIAGSLSYELIGLGIFFLGFFMSNYIATAAVTARHFRQAFEPKADKV